MKRSLPALLPFLTLSATAQIAYQYPSAIPPYGVYTFSARTGSVASSEFPQAAPFDFSAVFFDTPGTMHRAFVPAEGTLYWNFFPNATDCAYTYEPFGQDTAYVYGDLNASALKIVGTGSFEGGVSVYEEPWSMYTFPSYVGSTYTDDFSLDGVPCTGMNNPIAKGDLITPLGTTSNVVLILRVNNCGGGDVTEYLFFHDNDLINPLAKYNMDTEELTLCSQTSFSALNVNELATTPLRLCPNPARSETIRMQGLPRNRPGTLTLTGTDGRIALQRALTTNAAGELLIEGSELAAGTYVVELACTDGVDRRARLMVVR